MATDCGVCLYGGDFDGNDFQKSEGVTAKTPMVCCECGRKISAGELHERASWRDERPILGKPGQYRVFREYARTCNVCAEIAWAFSCEGRTYNILWESMEEVFPELNHGCFDRLKTPEAKKELQRRWIEWKLSKEG